MATLPRTPARWDCGYGGVQRQLLVVDDVGDCGVDADFRLDEGGASGGHELTISVRVITV
ncbi:MAG TPA: hypothetical protein VFY43_00745 [Candidatus Limnocylindria bacterium]|nr:hypothetical protein [Candidatus Limnocylindria bacterium]